MKELSLYKIPHLKLCMHNLPCFYILRAKYYYVYQAPVCDYELLHQWARKFKRFWDLTWHCTKKIWHTDKIISLILAPSVHTSRGYRYSLSKTMWIGYNVYKLRNDIYKMVIQTNNKNGHKLRILAHRPYMFIFMHNLNIRSFMFAYGTR